MYRNTNCTSVEPIGLWEAIRPLLSQAGCGKQCSLCFPERAVGSNTSFAYPSGLWEAIPPLLPKKRAVGSNSPFAFPSGLWEAIAPLLPQACCGNKGCALCTRSVLCAQGLCSVCSEDPSCTPNSAEGKGQSPPPNQCSTQAAGALATWPVKSIMSGLWGGRGLPTMPWADPAIRILPHMSSLHFEIGSPREVSYLV